MNVLITGGTGFIGSNVARQFYDLGYNIFFTGNDKENRVKGECVGYDFGKIRWGDLPEINVLIHMAAITDTTDYDEDRMFNINYNDSLALFNQAVKHDCYRIVYASSCSVYGDQQCIFEERMPLQPLNPYARSKADLDHAAMNFSWMESATVIGLRFSNVYGPNERHKGKSASMVSRIFWQMKEDNPTLFKDGEQRRDWVYYKDVVQAVFLASQSKKSGIYNVGRGVSVSFNNVVNLWNSVLNLYRVPNYIDNPYQGKYQDTTEVNIDKARKELGYNPKYFLDQGMRDYVS